MVTRVHQDDCPVPFCGKQKNVRYLLCPSCWRKVGRRQQLAFYKLVRRSDPPVTDKEYEEARNACIEKALESR